MFHFDYNTTLPLQCGALVVLFWIADVVWLIVPWDPNNI